MSRGEIISHIGEGRYRVRQKLAVERIQQEVTRLSQRIAELATELPSAQLELLEAENAVKDKAHEIDLLIPDFRSGVEGARAEIAKRQAELVPLQAAARKAELRVAELTAENLALLKRRNQLQAVPEDRELDVWCADYSLELTGEVGLVDVNDEGGQGVIIQPGHDDEAAYSSRRDGGLFPGLAQSGIQLYFNTAILPGVQKWMPRYRVGVISNIKNDTCTVTLDDARSSAQSLSINKSGVLHGIPVKYMDCNAGAFEDGDRVLVRYTSSGPLVVGFESSPKPCEVGTFAFVPAQHDDQTGYLIEFGEPEIAGDPLGTPGGAYPVWNFKPEGGSWQIEKFKPKNYGPQDWRGSDGLVLSWRGAPGRCYASWYISPVQAEMFGRAPMVFCRNQVVADISAVVNGAVVYGASVRNGTLTVIGGSLTDWFVIQYPWDQYNTTGPGTLIQTVAKDAEFQPISGWHFNRSGTRAVLTLNSGREKVAVRYFALGSGIGALSVIWEQDYIGVLTRSNFVGGQSALLDQPEHSIPIYVDYDGDQEVTAYFRHSRYTSSSYYMSYTVSTYSNQQALASIVLSTGQILASIGPYRNETLQHENPEGSFVWILSTSEKRITGNNFFIDIRSKVVMVEYEDEYTKDEFVGVPDDDRNVAGTVAGDIKRMFEMFVDGRKLLSLEMQRQQFNYPSTMQYREVGTGIGGPIDGPVPPDPDPSYELGPLSPELVNGEELKNVGYQAQGTSEIAALFLRYREQMSVTGQEDIGFDDHISGYQSVSNELFGGLSNMTLYAIGRL